ncbi:hypothetical protein GDO78_020344 [Eleutherodactylus coqui]|uniref:Uncharacterized protein n=2 Tax=Eleutherodactylus coqui TaxID=57060 RepID=A0A8J6EHX1_ELECQ|nr:hypothetical protein GDO78_020344 [Eleutherodactylus coqui]
MTRIVLPKMIQRKKGLIINMSSEAGNHAFPRLTIYSATKAFLDFFSRGLNIEYKSKGITVQSVMPLTVSTNMNQNMKQNLLVMGVDDYAWEALNTVGYSDRTSGCLSHGIQSYLLDLILSDSLMGSRFMAKFAKRAMDALEKTRKPKQK